MIRMDTPLPETVRFYAVRRGRRCGIYRTWPEAEKNVYRFPGALHKSFETLEAAEAFMAGVTVDQYLARIRMQARRDAARRRAQRRSSSAEPPAAT